MTPLHANDVSPSERNQVSITLSGKALEEFRIVSQWKDQPLASFLREILEQYHLNPGFANALRRAKRDMEMDDASKFKDEDE